jgi:hypothetical protein
MPERKVSFESGRKGGSGLRLGERDFNLNVSTKTQWQQKEKIANFYDDRGLEKFGGDINQ